MATTITTKDEKKPYYFVTELNVSVLKVSGIRPRSQSRQRRPNCANHCIGLLPTPCLAFGSKNTWFDKLKNCSISDLITLNAGFLAKNWSKFPLNKLLPAVAFSEACMLEAALRNPSGMLPWGVLANLRISRSLLANGPPMRGNQACLPSM